MLKLISPLTLNIVTMMIGIAISWGMMQAHIQDLERDVDKLQAALENHRLIEALQRCP